MLKNKSSKQERFNYSDGIHANSVIKKLKEIHFGPQIIVVPRRENSFTRRQSLRRSKDL